MQNFHFWSSWSNRDQIYLLSFSKNKTKQNKTKKQTKYRKTQISGYLLGMEWKGHKEEIIVRCKTTYMVVTEYIHYLYCDDYVMGVYIYQTYQDA